jgi:hypothetical protein
MDDDWLDWERVKTVRSMDPPYWLYHRTSGPNEIPMPIDGSYTSGDVAQKYNEVLQHYFNELVALLNPEGQPDGTGYERLLALRSNMEERQEEIAGPLEKWKDRAEYLQRLDWAYRNELHTRSEESEPKDVRQGQRPPLADKPIVEAFVDFDEDEQMVERPELDDHWMLERGSNPVSESPKPASRDDTLVRYFPSRETLEEWGINPEHVRGQYTRLQITPSTNWHDVLSQIAKWRNRIVLPKGRRYQRTADFLDFRLRLLENVLYRFETFGSVSKMTEEEALGELPDIFSEGSKPLEYAEEVQGVYEDDWEPPPEKMGDLKARIGEKGENKITQLQTVIREAGLSDLWEDRNPESFCSLVVRLVKRHYEI